MPDAAPATPAFAERILSQQGGAGLHAQGHVAVHGGLEFDGEKHVGPERAFGDGPAGDAPGHVGVAPAEPTTFLGYVLLPNGRRRLRRALFRGGPFGSPPVAVDGTWGGAAAHRLPGCPPASPVGWPGGLAGP